MKNITYIEDGVAASAAKLNQPLRMLDDNIRELEGRLNAFAAKESVIRENVPCDSTVTAGYAVYFDPTSGTLKKAQALIQATTGENGESIEAEASRMIGIVLEKTTSTTAKLLTGGAYTSTTLAATLLNSETALGMYYLSPETAGVLTRTVTGKLRQPVLVYYGNGIFSLNNSYLAHDNHYHKAFVLTPSNWEPVSLLSTWDPPTGATYGYDIGADTDLSALGDMQPETTSIFYNGLLNKDTGDFEVTTKTVWWFGASAPDMQTVLIMHFPFAYGESIVRTVSSESAKLDITSDNGNVVVDLKEYVDGGTELTGEALSSITGNTTKTTPVITSISGAVGVSADTASDGTCTIGLSSFLGADLDAAVINLNGAQEIAEDLFTYYVLPSRNVSNIAMSLGLSDVEDGALLSASAWAMSREDAVGTVVNLGFLPAPVSGTPVELADISAVASSFTASGDLASALYYLETPVTERVNITGPGTLFAKVSRTLLTGSDNKYHRVGFKLYGGTAPVESVTPTGETQLTATATAYEDIAIYTIVYSSGQTIKKATCLDEVSGNTVVGLSLEGVDSGDPCQYIIAGTVESDTFSFMPGPLYVGPLGYPVSTLPAGSLYTKRIGTAITPTKIEILLETTVFTPDESE
ncbi:MAG: hypothetical protein WC910_07095 [Bacteroidales bacterium]|jgi:hypothetical protein